MTKSPAQSSLSLAILITTLVALGPLSTDFYLPALPALTRDLASSTAQGQLTLSVFLLGFGAGQLVYGPLSDRFGRKPVLLGGLALYLAGTLGCWQAASMDSLIATRFIQALGACAGPVLGRAIVRDSYAPNDAARMLSYISSAMAIAPLLAPAAGGWLSDGYGWRACFIVLAVFSLLQLGASARLLGETNRQPDPHAIRAGVIVRNFACLLADRHFRACLLANALCYAALFAFISGSAFVFIDHMGLSPLHMGLAFGVMVSGYICGSFASGKLSHRFGAIRLMHKGALGALPLAAILLASSAIWPHSLLAILLPMWPLALCMGLIMPNSVALALAPFPHMAGAASSLLGSMQMLIAAAVGALVGHFVSNASWVMGCGIGLCMLAASLMARRISQPASKT